MSSKIEVSRELLEQAVSGEKVRPTLEGRNNTCIGCGNWMPHGHREAHEHEEGCPEEAAAVGRHWKSQLRALLAAPVVERQGVLPCDVRVAPATTIRKGCKVETLMRYIELRKGQPHEFTIFKGTAPPELAELQATIAEQRQLLATRVEASRLDEANETIARLMAENERLKGEQGEPVAYRYREGHAAWENEKPWEPTTLAHGAVLLDRKERAASGEFKGNSQAYYLALTVEPLYASQPAPVSADAAKAFAKGFNTLEIFDGKYKIVMQFAGHDDAWAAYIALSQMTASTRSRS